MSAIDINGVIGLGQIAVVALTAGVVLERLKNTRERQAEDRKDAKEAIEKLEQKFELKLEKVRTESLSSINAGDSVRDRRLERLEERIDHLETNLDEKMDAVVGKIEGVVSGLVSKLADLAGQVARIEGKFSQTRMPAIRDPRRDD